MHVGRCTLVTCARVSKSEKAVWRGDVGWSPIDSSSAVMQCWQLTRAAVLKCRKPRDFGAFWTPLCPKVGVPGDRLIPCHCQLMEWNSFCLQSLAGTQILRGCAFGPSCDVHQINTSWFFIVFVPCTQYDHSFVNTNTCTTSSQVKIY